MDSTPAPDVTGPSELGLALGVSASPDVLTTDGEATATVVVTARNGSGEPARGLGLRAETVFQGQIQDVGHLSSKTATTGSDGRAVLYYTAPAGSQGVSADSGNNIVTIRITPVNGDYSAAVPRSVDIRLVPQGPVAPPAAAPVARFRFEPSTPKEEEVVRFDGSLSRDCALGQTESACLAQPGPSPTLVSYVWEWGDGRRSEGMSQSHAYSTAGTYTVRLTVTNQRGLTDSESAFITVGAGQPTKADFTVSPSDPLPGQTVFFDGRASTTPEGVTITAWEWTFGDGGSGSGSQVSHTYAAEGTYTVTLVVTDSRGQTARTTKSVPVKIPPPPD